jgi:prophage antirepressor-like protein
MTELINSIDMNLSFNDETIRVLGTSENPMFVVKDICNILGLTNVTETLRNIPEKWRSSVSLKTGNSSNFQTSCVVNEAGLYKIIMRSNKVISQPFQEFVCEEILPSIRKTGEYKYQKILDEKNKLEEENKIIKDQKIKVEEEVKKLRKKYVKQPKEVLAQKNVVYLMTSEESEKVGEYNVGKALDLSKRKESYNHNKLHNFKVIYYISCKNSKFMDLLESIILMKLEKYRCKAGRDVFLLPTQETSFVDIKVFTNIFDECLKFYDGIDEAIYPKRTIQEDKEKQKERNIKYQEEHKEEIKEKMNEYYQDNKDILSDIKKEYCEKNADVIAKKQKEYYEKNKEAVIENVMEYYEENKESILEERKVFYQDNKQHILEERAKYYKENYKTKIAAQRKEKEKCECGMIITHYGMKRHKNTDRHKKLMEKKSIL